MVRSRWRKQIGMSDDHDECEWVNVSSGTGQIPQSRKTVVCVCVCVCFVCRALTGSLSVFICSMCSNHCSRHSQSLL